MGAMTFLMILIVHMYWEWQGVQRYWGAITPTMPFWAEWRSSMASHSTRGGCQEFTSADDTSGGISSPEESLYEEVQVQEEEVEYTEVTDWESDAKINTSEMAFYMPIIHSKQDLTFRHSGSWRNILGTPGPNLIFTSAGMSSKMPVGHRNM